MYRHTIQSQRLPLAGYLFASRGLGNPPLFIHLCFGIFQPRQHISALICSRQIQHLSKHGTFTIQVGLWREGDEKLTPVGRGICRVLQARSCSVLDGTGGHGQNAPRVVAKNGNMNLLIQGHGMIDGRAAFGDAIEWEDGSGGSCWTERYVATLYHEGWDEAVERSVIIGTRCAKGKEVLTIQSVDIYREHYHELGRSKIFVEQGHTSAVLGAVSQKISTLRSPCVV